MVQGSSRLFCITLLNASILFSLLQIGCFLCIVGSVLIVIHSPKSEELKTFKELHEKLMDYLFLTYVATIFFMCLIIKVIFVPRYGNQNIAVYLLLCSAIGSLTVVFCKAVALGIKETIAGTVNNLFNYLFWLLLIASVGCIMIQMNYLNKSLDIFNTSVVSPVYYVMFTVLVIIASGILFREWEHMEVVDILGCVCGFLVVMTAIFMLNAFKDVQMTFKDLNLNARRRRSALDVESDSNFLSSLHNNRQA